MREICRQVDVSFRMAKFSMSLGLKGNQFGETVYINFTKYNKDLLWSYLYAAKGYSTDIWFELYKQCVIDLVS